MHSGSCPPMGTTGSARSGQPTLTDILHVSCQSCQEGPIVSFTDEEAQSQVGKIICLRSHMLKAEIQTPKLFPQEAPGAAEGQRRNSPALAPLLS